MKVCIVTPKLLRSDGQGRVNYELALYLARAGHQVSLIAMVIDPALDGLENVSCLRIPPPRWLPTALLRNQYFALRSCQLLTTLAPDLDIVHLNGSLTYYPADINTSHFVHSNWLRSAYHPSRTFAAKNFGRMYAAYQWFYTQLNAEWERKAYQAASVVVAVSDFVKSSLVQDAQIIPDKIVTVLNGVDTQEFHPLEKNAENLLRKELNLASDQFVVFFAGGIRTNRKNLDLTLNALTQLDCSVHLVVAGSTVGSAYPNIAQELNIHNRVHFLGHRNDVSNLLRCADAFAFPSHYDPFSLSVLEALASGVPVITAPSVGSSVLIRSGINGFLLEHSDDLDGMITALSYLTKYPDSAAQIGMNGRRTAEAHSWLHMAKQYEEIYQTVYQEKRMNSVHKLPESRPLEQKI
ncbi:glycosyl transferase [filamentous cyanobacterium CCT1]|nr:glycosyl transferase [filamentous cyanobacterium CCT1]PSN79766.1 glycosyl transferase [filamentous cyanobacterium CCP4]